MLFPLTIHYLISTQLQPQKKIALVIGIGNYISGRILSNPENDTRAMKVAMQNVGFTVIGYVNLNQGQKMKAIDEFGVSLTYYNLNL